MREPASNYSANHYERPNQPWICGHSESGHACPAGPTARGRCPAMGECAPIRSGDRWECNRSLLRGGPCDTGPTPEGACGRVLKCHPMRGLRIVRGRFVRACAVLAAGLFIIVLSGNWRDRVITPGPLAREHAQLMERTGAAANCAACHTAAENRVGEWAVSLVQRQPNEESQPQLCMKCHAKTISKELALAAHNLPANALDQLTNSSIKFVSVTEQKAAAAENDNQEPRRPFAENKEKSIACSACHREHHGAEVDLTAIDNVACQSCHQRRLESFGIDHPDFGNWPYERRTRIAFNHASHRDKHFAEKKRSFDCRSCHAEDASGKAELTTSYEKACASCHDEKIATSIARGAPMFALPTMDIAAMRSAGFDMGTWPKGATGDFDGRLSPVMKLLLAADPAAAQAMAKLGAGFDFQDVNPKDRQQLDACAALTTAITKLIGELAQSPETTICSRLETVLGRPLSRTDATNLAAGLSADTLRAAAQQWFGTRPASDATVPSRAATTNEPTLLQAHAESTAFGPAGAWSRDEASFSIRYCPRAHADPVLTSWLNILASSNGSKSAALDSPDSFRGPIIAAVFKELSKANAPGLCISCHSIEQESTNKIAINWHTADRGTEPRGFTKFSHKPHLLLPQLSDCTHCHAIDSKAAASTVYTNLNPATFASDFTPMAKQACATCHTAQAAGDECQKCHNYHVERVEDWRGKNSTIEQLRTAQARWPDSPSNPR